MKAQASERARKMRNKAENKGKYIPETVTYLQAVFPGTELYRHKTELLLKHYRESGESFDTLQTEILTMRLLISRNMELVEQLKEDDDNIGKKVWAMGEITKMIERLSLVAERHAAIKYSDKYNITPKEAREMIAIFQKAVAANVKDPEVVKNILLSMKESMIPMVKSQGVNNV